MTTSPMVLDGVVKRYGDFVLDISLEVPRGYVMGFVGANGAGKTTTIKCGLGSVIPDEGAVDLIDKTRIGVVLDTPPYAGEWTVAETGRLLGRFFPEWDADRFTAMTAGSDVPGDRAVKELSRGMGMKLQLAVALSHGAEFLILDEPTSGLDPYARDSFLEELGEFVTDERHSVLFSTHITSDLDRIADYVVVLDHGRVLEVGTKDEVIDSYRKISGGPGELSAETEALVLGLRKHGAGWDGLMRTEDTIHLGSGVLQEPPTLEDLVVRIAKENANA